MASQENREILSLPEIGKRNRVSLSTVYRILRHPERCKNPAQRRVRGWLIQYGYLKYEETPTVADTILYVVTQSTYGHSISIFFELQRLCIDKNIRVILCYEDMLEAMIASVRPAGMISGAFLQRDYGLPLVLINRSTPTHHYSSVDCDDVGALVSLFGYLKKLGHRRIGYFNDHPEYQTSYPLRHCREMIQDFYRWNQLEFSRELLFCEPLTPENHHRVTIRAADYFLKLKPRPTALVFCSDIYAHNFYEHFRKAGLRIPEDISLAAYDNILDNQNVPAQSGLFYNAEIINQVNQNKPALTVMNRPLPAMAAAALDILLAELADPQCPRRRLLLAPSLDIKQSVAPPNRQYGS